MIPNLCWHTVPTHGSKRNMWYGVNTFRLWSWLSRCRWRGRLGVFTCISQEKKKKETERFLHLKLYCLKTWHQTGVDIQSLHMVPKGICKMVQIPSVCETGWADVADVDDWAFLPAIQKEKKVEKGFFICNCNGLKHDTKLVLTCIVPTYGSKRNM